MELVHSLKLVHCDGNNVVTGYTTFYEGDVCPVAGNYFAIDDRIEVIPGMLADPVAKTVSVNPNPPRDVEGICAQIDAERDRRIHTRFQFGGVWYQCREQDVVNINGMAASALSAIIIADKAGRDISSDLRWSDPTKDFYWIAEDNSHVLMTAPTVVELGNAYARFRSAIILQASALKQRVRAGETVDWISDTAWPA